MGDFFSPLSCSLCPSYSCTSHPPATLPKLLAANLPLPWQAHPHHLPSFVPKCRPCLLLPPAYQQPSTCEVPGSSELLGGRLFLQRLHCFYRPLLTFFFYITLHFLSLFQVSDPSAVQRAPARLMRDPVSTLPKPRSLLGEMHGYGQTKAQLRTSLVGLVRPASAHGAGGERGGGRGGERGGVSSLSSSPHHCPLDLGFPLAAEVTKPTPTNHHFLLFTHPQTRKTSF